MGCRWGHIWSVGTGVWLHLQEVIGLVFEDIDIVFLRTTVDIAAALLALRSTSWILPTRHRVKEPGFLGTTVRSWIPVGKDIVHRRGEKPLFVHFDPDALHAHWGGSLDSGGESVFF